MDKKTEFRTVTFFRMVRDQLAAALEGKSPDEIIAFYAKEKAKLLPRKASHAKPAALTSRALKQEAGA
jgi:hypothetical protein